MRVNFVVWGTERRALCLLSKIYYKADHPLQEHLHHFVAARNASASLALNELSLIIPLCKIDQFARSYLPAVGVCGTCYHRMCLVVAL